MKREERGGYHCEGAEAFEARSTRQPITIAWIVSPGFAVIAMTINAPLDIQRHACSFV